MAPSPFYPNPFFCPLLRFLKSQAFLPQIFPHSPHFRAEASHRVKSPHTCPTSKVHPLSSSLRPVAVDMWGIALQGGSHRHVPNPHARHFLYNQPAPVAIHHNTLWHKSVWEHPGSNKFSPTSYMRFFARVKPLRELA